MGCWIDKNIDDLELKIKDYCPFSSRFTTIDNSTMEMPSPKTNSQNDNNKMNIEYDNSNNIQFFKSPNTKMNNNEENYNILNSIYLNTPMNNDQVKDNNLQNSQNIINKIDNNDETFQLLKSKNKEIYQSIKEPLFKSVLGLLPIIPKQIKGPFVEYINQIITITDYGQEIETELEIKIVNIDDDEYSSSYTINFDLSAIIEDIEIDADEGIKSIFNGHKLIFKYKLFIDDKFRVKYKYKLKRNNICKYYRSEFIGIQKMFAGAVGKYIINIPNDYCVINSENDIFKTEVLNKKYIWEDIIPENGLIDYIRISHWSAKWKCSIYQEFETEYENDYIRHVEIYTPKFYVGGNLTNQKYEIRCALNEGIDNKCIQDLGNRYKFLMENVNTQSVFFQIVSRFTININTPYKINIKEEDLPKLNDIEKDYFKKITLDILNNDKSNKPDYFKIGKYIKNYLTYDVSYTNINLSPKDIYLQKKGVCSHFTILYNSLLNSIDIPTIYVSGIAISEEGNLDKINQIKDQNHAWTLAKINNKWIPLDCTWGLLNGILPVSHIFKYYLKSDIEYILGREKKLSLKEEFKNLDK
jgi:hypothetical protein